MCVVTSKNPVVLFEAWLTFVLRVLIENNKPDRLVAQNPHRAPKVQKSPYNISA